MRKLIAAFGLVATCVLVAKAGNPATGARPASSPVSRELGLPFFDVFEPRDYRGHMQVWSAVEDAAGLVYFGNYGRVLTYDGARWDSIEVPGTSFVRALVIDAQDVLWIGGVNELGYAKTDSTGRRVFVSLKGELPAQERDLGELWRVMLTPHGPLFQSNSRLLRWNGHAFATLALTQPGSWQTAVTGDITWISHNQNGWFVLHDDGSALSLISHERPAVFDGAALAFALPGTIKGEYLFGTARAGLIRWDGKGFTPFKTEIDDILKQKRLYRGARMADGRIVLTLLQAGAFILNAQGRLLAQLDEAAGLPDNGAISPFVARDGSIWICLQRGMVRVDARPWLTWFGPARGAARNEFEAPVRFHGEIYAATDSGPLRLERAQAGAAARLVPVPGFTDQMNGLTATDKGLIGYGSTGIFEWTGVELNRLPGETSNVFGFFEALGQPGRWFALMDGGLHSYQRVKGTWTAEGPVAGLENVRSMAMEDNGTWWMGTPSEGVMRVTFPHAGEAGPGQPVITRFTAGHGLPEGHGWSRISIDTGGPLLRCEKGFFRFDGKTQTFRTTNEYGERFANGTTTARSMASDDFRDGVWIVARPAGQSEIVTNLEFGVFGKKGWQPLHLPQLVRLDDVSGLYYEEKEDLLWMSGHAGLIRLDLEKWRGAPAEPPPVIGLRSVEHGAGKQLPLDGGWQLPYDQRSLQMKFSAPLLTGDPSSLYESTLSGDGDPVILADAVPQREFSALAAGHYRLQLRARSGEGRWSAPVEIAFTIQPPWWASGWAGLASAIITAVLIALYIRSRTQALRRRAGELEAIVTKRTEELLRSNRELVRLHKLELDEKIAARLAEEKARLEVLRYQLNPHFLFNALTAVCAQLPPSLSGARATLERLTDFCQFTLFRPAGDESPTLGQEMKMLSAYLDIERTRWGELLEVSVEVDAAAEGIKIPSLLLLPLVENALKYGQATTREKLRINLAARCGPGESLQIEVANTGEWVSPAERGIAPSLGIGHENLRQRLQRYYPGAHEFTTHAADGWVTVKLKIGPLRPAV